jgi:hypothetical protein
VPGESALHFRASVIAGKGRGEHLIPLVEAHGVSNRGEALARKFEQANDDLIRQVEHMPDEQWGSPCSDTGELRTVGVLAYHVANSHIALLSMAQAAAKGQPMPQVSWEMIHGMNAQQAEANANCTREETIGLLRQNGQTVSGTLRQMTDEQLDRTTMLPLFSDQPITTERLVDVLVIGHIGVHTKSF